MCKQEVQLHVVQEIIDILQNSELQESEDTDSVMEAHMITISAVVVGGKPDKTVRTMQLRVQLQGHNLRFLVDSGSTHSFLDASLSAKLQEVVPMPKVLVKIAKGDTMPCNSQLLNCTCNCSGHKFVSISPQQL